MQLDNNHESRTDIVRVQEKNRPVLRFVAIASLGLVFVFLALFVTWYELFRTITDGFRISETVKGLSIDDQLSYLTIAQNVRDGLKTYAEPMTYSGHSIYPSTYYWLLGVFAKIFAINVFAAWNIVGFITSLFAIVSFAYLAYTIARHRLAVLAGTFPFLVNTYAYFTNDGAWKIESQGHAVLWSAIPILFNPSAEVLALGLVAIAFSALLRVFDEGFPVRNRTFFTLLFIGAIIGLCLTAHTYVTLYSVSIIVFSCSIYAISLYASRLQKTLFAAISFASIGIAANISLGGPLVQLSFLLAINTIPLAFIAFVKQRKLLQLIAVPIGIIVFGAPLLVRILIDASRPDSFFFSRQKSAEIAHLSLPSFAMLLHTSPLLIGMFLFAIVLTKRYKKFKTLVDTEANFEDTSPQTPEMDQDACRRSTYARLSFIGGILCASVLLVHNDLWGMNQEPYRFFPYGFLFCSIIVGSWILSRWSFRSELALRVLIVLALLCTIPTTSMFVREKGNSLIVGTDDQIALLSIITDEKPKGLVMVDGCIRSRILASITSARVVDYNKGMAYPKNSDAIDRALLEQQQLGIPSPDTLLAAQIVGFIKADPCETLEKERLVSRFGEPTSIRNVDNPTPHTFYYFRVNK